MYKCQDCGKGYPFSRYYWNGKPYCSTCGGHNVLDQTKPSGAWILESEIEKQIARLRSDVEMFRDSHRDISAKYSQAIAERTAIIERTAAFIKIADDSIARLHSTLEATRSSVAKKLAEFGLNAEQVNAVLALFPPKVG